MNTPEQPSDAQICENLCNSILKISDNIVLKVATTPSLHEKSHNSILVMLIREQFVLMRDVYKEISASSEIFEDSDDIMVLLEKITFFIKEIARSSESISFDELISLKIVNKNLNKIWSEIVEEIKIIEVETKRVQAEVDSITN